MGNENSEYYNQSLRAEDEIVRNTLNDFEREFEFYERSLNLASDVISHLYELSRSKKLPDGKFPVLCMLPRLLGTIQSIRTLTMKGYYYDVAILGRTLLENLGLCLYLARNEDEAWNWLTGRDVHIPKIKLLDILFSLSSPDQKTGKTVYGELCNYVHANLRANGPTFLSPTLIENELRVDVAFPPFYNKKKAADSVGYSFMLLIVIMEVFKSELRENSKERILNVLSEYIADR